MLPVSLAKKSHHDPANYPRRRARARHCRSVDLYEQAGRERFPTVDAVRRLSRADMDQYQLL